MSAEYFLSFNTFSPIKALRTVLSRILVRNRLLMRQLVWLRSSLVEGASQKTINIITFQKRIDCMTITTCRSISNNIDRIAKCRCFGKSSANFFSFLPGGTNWRSVFSTASVAIIPGPPALVIIPIRFPFGGCLVTKILRSRRALPRYLLE